MIKRFSVRYDFQLFQNHNNCKKTTRNRLFYAFYRTFVLPNISKTKVVYDVVEDALIYFGQECHMENDIEDHSINIKILENFILHDCYWSDVYDFIEFVIQNTSQSLSAPFIKKVNKILEEELTECQIVGNIVVLITNPQEIQEIEAAIDGLPEHVSISIIKALKLFSQRPKPDSNNAIKEAISAVEALCCTIAKDFGAKDNIDTLGKALDYITSKKATHPVIHLHPSLKSAIDKLYGFTSDEDGIRHGGDSYTEEDVATARFIIVTCSSILNFLMVKWEKAKEGKDV